MKTQFGSALHRLVRGGIKLKPLEEAVLRLLPEQIAEPFREPLLQQLDAYNLAQRHVEWRGVYFYRMLGGRVDRTGLPQLPCLSGEVKLLSVAFTLPTSTNPLHVAFWSVDRAFFGFDTGESLYPHRQSSQIQLGKVQQSWRSNFEPKPEAP